MNYFKALAAAAVIIASSFAGHAKAFTGNDLLRNCDIDKFGMCLGYIAGAVETGSGYCPSDDVTYGQSREVVMQYLRTYPQVLHYNASVLVLAAMRRAFPCSK